MENFFRGMKKYEKNFLPQEANSCGKNKIYIEKKIQVKIDENKRLKSKANPCIIGKK